MDKQQPHPNSAIQSICRAVSVLRSFSEAEPELSVTVLSRRLTLHKSTVSRILATLQYEGLVDQNPDNGKYRLGVGLISLAGVALGRLDARSVAQSYLDHLVSVSKETVNLAVLDGLECVTVDRAPSPQPLRYVGWIGRRMPLHCTASGQVFLAFMPDDEQIRILSLPLVTYTEKTVVDAGGLRQALAQIQRQGYAIVHEEFETGFSSIAAPVFNQSARIVAAISIAGPTYRMDPAQIASLIEPLSQTVQTISKELGYRQ